MGELSYTEQLAQAFRACTLPIDAWTHAAHMRVGLWHVLQFGAEQALDEMRAGIRRYNEATGVANTDSSGYHETLTRLYVTLIARFLATLERHEPLDAIGDELLVQYGARDVPLRYFSRESLRSVAARRDWVEPDLQPLD